MTDENGIEKTMELKEKIKKFKADLPISRVPAPTLDRFKMLAGQECSDDYGMALKYLMDFYLNFGEKEYILRRLDIHEQRLLILEQSVGAEPAGEKKEEPKVKTIKMLDGKERIVGKGSDDNE